MLKRTLLGTTLLVAFAAPALAGGNSIRIDTDANGGSLKTLSITQDATGSDNQVSGDAAGTTALEIGGAWNSVSVTQTGSKNKLYGSVKTSTTTSSTAAIDASYTTQGAGANNHSLTIGSTTAPANPSVTVAVTNTGDSDNTIADTLDAASLTYNLSLSGTGNAVTNAVATSGATTLNQGGGGHGITGDSNTVQNTVSGVASFTHNLTVTGSSNTITNTASGTGDRTITESLASDGNSVAATLDGSGVQTAALTADAGTTADVTLKSSANNGAINLILSNVVGGDAATPTAANVYVEQTALADSATANLTVSGGSFHMGTGLGGSGTAGAYVYQNSASAYLNATVTAAAEGYTVNITQ